MGFLSKLFGYRWSLYILNNGQLAFAMHENSVIRIVGYVMGYFGKGGRPVPPWQLCLNFNRNNQIIELGAQHFPSAGGDVSPLLIQQIEAIDSGWQVRGGEPVFEEASTRKRLKIGDEDFASGRIDIHKMLAEMQKSKDLSFHDVMDKVFGK